MLDRDYQHGNGPDKEPWFGRFTSQMEDTCGSMPGALKCSTVASGRVRTHLWSAPVVLCATADFHHPRPRPPRPPSHIVHLVMFGHVHVQSVHVVVLIEVHAVVHRRNKVGSR